MKDKEMSTAEEPEEAVLIKKLQEYVRNRREIEAALELDPRNRDLIDLEGDLSELIDLTRRKLADVLTKNKDSDKTDVIAVDASSTAKSASEIESSSTQSASSFQHTDAPISSNVVVVPMTIPVVGHTSRKAQQQPPVPVHVCTGVKVGYYVSDQDLLDDTEWFRIRSDPMYKGIVLNRLRRRRAALKWRFFHPNCVNTKFEARRKLLMERHNSR